MSDSSISLGSVIYTAVKPIFKIYFIIGIGFYLGRRNVLTVETSRNVSDIVLTVILPCLIFDKIVNNIDNGDIKQIGIILLTAVFLFSAGGIGGYLTYLLTPVPKHWFGGCISVGFFSNISDLPILYIQTLDTGTVFTKSEGDKGVAYICIFLALQILCQFNLGGYRLIQLDFDRLIKTVKEDEEKQLETPCDEEEAVKDESKEQLAHDHQGSATPDQFDDADNAVSLTSLSSEEEGRQVTHLQRKASKDQWQHERFLSARMSMVSKRPSRNLTTTQSNISTASSTARNIDLRKLPSQGINELVHEYSQVENLRNSEPTVGKMTELSLKPTHRSDTEESSIGNEKPRSSVVRKFLLEQLKSVLENFKRPPSVALVLGITISMIPWVKLLFVETSQLYIHALPDDLPPLSFVMDLTSYVANACVPLGLLLLGATLSRLQVGQMPKGYWKVPLLLAILRLIILPVIGMAFVNKLQRDGWFEGDKILEFVCGVNFGLPNATSLIYLTAFYTPPDNDDFRLQMDYLSLTYLTQYPILAISLPFLTTFILKVLIKV